MVMKQAHRHLVMVLLVVGLAADVVRAQLYAPPEMGGINVTQIETLRNEISQHQLADAAKLVDGLLAQHGDELLQDQSTWRCLGIVLGQAVGPDQAAFTAEFSKQFAAAAHDALQAMKLSRHDDPAGLCALAARYPFTPTAGEALALAGRREAERGDLPAAQALFAKAAQAGWAADPDERKLVDKIKGLLAVEALPGGEAGGYVGQLPFDARWYFNEQAVPGGYPEARSFPVSGGSLIFVQTPKRLIAWKPNGGAGWVASLYDTDAAKPPARPAAPAPVPKRPVLPGDPNFTLPPAMPGAPVTLMPAVLSHEGTAQVVAVKVVVPDQGITMVRCYRASDGRELWNTRNQDSLADMAFQGSPVICGGYVYLMGQQRNGVQSQLWMVALDTTTGGEIWRTKLGVCTRQGMPMIMWRMAPAGAGAGGGVVMVGGRPMVPVMDPRANSLPDEPMLAVSDDVVIATPGVGYVMALNRFTGKLRWLSQYVTNNDPNRLLKRTRYDTRPVFAGGMVAIAPVDAPRVMGLDMATGEVKWDAPNAEASAVLFGSSGDSFLLAAPKGLLALDAHDGSKRWTYKSAGGPGTVTGPSIVAGQAVLAPVSGKMTAISLADGRVVVTPLRIPILAEVIASEGNRQLLQTDGILVNFGSPLPIPPKPIR